MTRPASKVVAAGILFAAGVLLAMTDRASAEYRLSVSLGAARIYRVGPAAARCRLVRIKQHAPCRSPRQERCDRDPRADRHDRDRAKAGRRGRGHHRDAYYRCRRWRHPCVSPFRGYRRKRLIRPYPGRSRVIVVWPSHMWIWTRPLFRFEWHD